MAWGFGAAGPQSYFGPILNGSRQPFPSPFSEGAPSTGNIILWSWGTRGGESLPAEGGAELGSPGEPGGWFCV